MPFISYLNEDEAWCALEKGDWFHLINIGLVGGLVVWGVLWWYISAWLKDHVRLTDEELARLARMGERLLSSYMESSHDTTYVKTEYNSSDMPDTGED